MQRLNLRIRLGQVAKGSLRETHTTGREPGPRDAFTREVVFKELAAKGDSVEHPEILIDRANDSLLKLAPRIANPIPALRIDRHTAALHSGNGLRIPAPEKRRGQFFCANAKNGETLWTAGGRQGDNAAVLLGDGVVLALNTKSELVVFSATDKKYEELARYKVADTPTWAHPAFTSQGVLIKDLDSLALWSF